MSPMERLQPAKNAIGSFSYMVQRQGLRKITIRKDYFKNGRMRRGVVTRLAKKHGVVKSAISQVVHELTYRGV